VTVSSLTKLLLARADRAGTFTRVGVGVGAAVVETDDGGPPPAATDDGVGLDVALVLAALATATIGQGGYYRRVSAVSAVLLAMAAVALFARAKLPTLRPGGRALAGLGALLATTVVTAAADGHPASAAGPVALLIGLAIIVAVVSASTAAVRRQLTDATIALGALLAATAWVGVAFHVRPLGHPDGGLWRAATTVTYANAAAAILGPLALWALARATTRTVWTTRAAAVLLLTGLGATLSRAGLAAFVVGLVVLSALLGFRVVWRAVGTIVIGGVIAALALAPGMADLRPTKPLWAILGLAVGLGVGLVSIGGSARPRRRSKTNQIGPLRVGWVVGVGGLAVVVALVVGFSGHVPAWSGRFSLSSPDRSSLTSVALHMWHSHILTGVGPGRALFTWTTPFHVLVFDRYAHNEYLQIAVEQGLLGLAGLAALVLGVAGSVFGGRRARSRSRSRRDDGAARELAAIRAGAIAGLICFAIHSGFDFLWHVPAVPMIAALAVGLSTRVPSETVSSPPAQPQTQEVS
jgi:hypothetical protein